MKLSVGEWVEVRNKQEILATLDEQGQLEGMPFMPEMFAYCGQRFRVYKRSHKTCDTVFPTRSRRISNAVHLETRCDGRAHGGCEARCLIFWKEAWLKPVDGNSKSAQAGPIPSKGCTEEAVERAGMPFSFANTRIGKTKFTYPEGFERFLTAYEVDDATWQDFLDYATHADSKLVRADIDQARAALSRSLKREIAGNLWGPTERYRVLVSGDPALAEAQKQFPKASDLLALNVSGEGEGSPRTPFGDPGTADR